MKTADQKRIEKLELEIEELTREIRNLRNEISIGNHRPQKTRDNIWPESPEYPYVPRAPWFGSEIICCGLPMYNGKI